MPEYFERSLDGIRRGDLARSRVHYFYQRLLAFHRVDGLREQPGRQVQIHTARTAGDSRANRTGHANADIFGVQHAIGGLGVWPRGIQLVHLLVVALLQIDDLPLAGSANQDHRKAVGRGIGERRQAVQKAGRGHGQANARLFGHEASDGCRVTRMLFMAKADEAHPFGLREAREVGDGNTHQAENRVEVVQFQRVDDQMKSIGHRRSCPLLLRLLCSGLQVAPSFCHDVSPPRRDVV